MTSIAPPCHVDASLGSRRLVGLLLGVVAEVVLLAALAYAAWGDGGDDYQPLSLEDGLTWIAVFGGVGGALVLGAALCIALTRQTWGTVMATLLMLGASFVGFVGFFLTSISRQEISDC